MNEWSPPSSSPRLTPSRQDSLSIQSFFLLFLLVCFVHSSPSQFHGSLLSKDMNNEPLLFLFWSFLALPRAQCGARSNLHHVRLDPGKFSRSSASIDACCGLWRRNAVLVTKPNVEWFVFVFQSTWDISIYLFRLSGHCSCDYHKVCVCMVFLSFSNPNMDGASKQHASCFPQRNKSNVIDSLTRRSSRLRLWPTHARTEK